VVYYFIENLRLEMKKTMIFKSNSENDTAKFAEELANNLGDFKIVCLYGELGAGKTTFTKSFTKALGVKSRIISPTYVFVRTHTAKKKKLYHIDAYRLESVDGKDEIKEILGENNAIIVIEWAEKIKSILPKKRIDIEFIYKNKNEREIRVSKH
jgi:tRNA threonylcarbamoyladenosine biosynthesis protein TsaE